MELKPGYKMTEVGVIPEDWEVMPLGKLVRSVEYGSAAKSNIKGTVPVLRMGNLQDGKIDWSDLVYTDDIDEINKYTLQAGDVLFNRTNTIDLVGKTSIYEGGRPAIFAGYLIRIIVLSELLDSRFLNYILNTEFSRKYSAKVLSVAVGQANINGQKLKTYPIPLPPTTTEQDAIATALNDLDALLAALDRLIAKKQAIKQATMQPLLTGKKRLPGFSGAWEVKRLGEVGATYGGLTGKTKSDFGVGAAKYITFMNVMKNTIIDYSACEQVNVSASENQNRVQRGDLLFNGSSETPEEVAFCSLMVESAPDLYLNSFCFGFRLFDNQQVDGLFLTYYIRANPGREIMKSLAQGSTRYNLSKTALCEASVLLPLKAEQTAIAAVLSDMDAELSALKTRRDKTRQLKHAMMQELLTGKTRLLTQEHNHA